MVSTKKSQAYTALKLKARARHAAEITVHEDQERTQRHTVLSSIHY